MTVLAISTANDQLSSFTIDIQSIVLTNQTGETVSLLRAPQLAEFIHLNGSAAPVATVTVPQGVYTAAAISYSQPVFACVVVNSSGGIVMNNFGGSSATQAATANLGAPLVISGPAMTLSLDLQVSQSVAFSSCDMSATYSIAPAFNLSEAAVSAQPGNVRNGKLSGMKGRVTLTGNNNLTIAINNGFSFPSLPNGPVLSITTDGDTAYQGIGGLSAISVGTFVDLDAAIQLNGSLLATRIAVDDPTAWNVMIGPVAQVYGAPANLVMEIGRQQQGDDLSVNPITYNYFVCNGNTTYATSGQFANLENLPFTATFNSASLAAGQNVSVAFTAQTYYGGTEPYAAVMRLEPQTINGTVTAVSTNGNFTLYNVALAPYDFISTLSWTNKVVVYVESGNTQDFTSMPVNVGSVLRANGLLFNDNGTLRLVAGQINDGVKE